MNAVRQPLGNAAVGGDDRDAAADGGLERNQTEGFPGSGGEEQHVRGVEPSERLRMRQLPVKPDLLNQSKPRHLVLEAEALRSSPEDVELDVRVAPVTELSDRLHRDVHPLLPGQLADGETAQRPPCLVPDIASGGPRPGDPIGYDAHAPPEIAAPLGDLVENTLAAGDPRPGEAMGEDVGKRAVPLGAEPRQPERHGIAQMPDPGQPSHLDGKRDGHAPDTGEVGEVDDVRMEVLDLLPEQIDVVTVHDERSGGGRPPIGGQEERVRGLIVAQHAPDLVTIIAHRRCPWRRRQHPHRVPPTPELGDHLAAGDLVAAHDVGGKVVAEREDSHQLMTNWR